ncbi:MAG: succinate dehydrogenase iron-sulfur subunit [Phycisphaeraceae bacterium]|nr:succinate dehydrogenase iron-sulfur subunit [Phycisphaerae bacterium]MBX3391815.1 succinate dehydrogenase iron-sulfur subunit [Phycisphaeraceae bacterium]HRJ49111.1 succinate dehydrogenase iron-sulfur subunit [Phycisphaerales bacterium]
MTTTQARQSSARRPVPGRTIRLRILRCDGPGKPSRWETFSIKVESGANIISCLQQVAANPVTADGRATTPVVWDSGCLEEVCGACTMVINGKVRQSCSCLVDEYAPGEGDQITLEPMSKFPVVRDLWVDRSRLFHALRRVKAWVPIDGTYHLGHGPRESPDAQATRYVLSECMSCGCCLEACPQYNVEPDASAWDTSFIGAHAISQARLFNMHPTGRQLAGERLEALAGPGGVNDCGNAQNCVKVCPKHIPLTESIAAIGRQSTVHAIASWFARG